MGRLPRGFRVPTAALLLAVSASAGPPQDSPLATATYRSIVSAYRDADAGSLRRLAALPPSTVETFVDGIVGAPRTEWSADDVRAAAMLHTDTAVELMQRGNTAAGIVHINLAARLIDSTLETSPEYRTYSARWYRFAAAFVRPYSEPWANELEERARRRLKSSPAAAALWRARQQELLRRKPESLAPHVPSVRSTLTAGFEQAVRIDPESYEAWLHLGRVRMDMPGATGAEAALRMAAASPERRIRYLAAMFLGALSERAGRFDEAERSYREAAATYPWGQSAPLALAHVLSRTARESEARDALAAHLVRSRGMVVDPLWTYFLAPDELLDATLNELRVEVMR